MQKNALEKEKHDSCWSGTQGTASFCIIVVAFHLEKGLQTHPQRPAAPGAIFPRGAPLPSPLLSLPLSPGAPPLRPVALPEPPGAGLGRAVLPSPGELPRRRRRRRRRQRRRLSPARPGRPPAGEWGLTAPPPRWLRGDTGPARLYGVVVAALGPQPAPQPRLQPPGVAGAGRGPRLPAPGTASPEVPWQSGDPAKKGPGGGCCPPPCTCPIAPALCCRPCAPALCLC